MEYSTAALIGIAVFQLALLCGFFPFPADFSAPGLKLFFKILGLTILPAAIVAGTSAFGFAAMKKAFPDFAERSVPFRIVSGMSLGLATYLFLLSVSSNFFGYNLASTLVPLALIAGMGWKEYAGMAKSLLKPAFTADNHKSDDGLEKLIAFRLVSSEILFLVLTFLVAVNFVNAVRPMPIGWDDLGVYMNYPRIMAETGEI